MTRRPWKIGLSWIFLSPLVFLMAAVATPPDSIIDMSSYWLMVAVAGIWTALAIVAGVGVLSNQAWAQSLKNILFWVLVIYFLGSLVLILGFMGATLVVPDSWGLGTHWLVAIAIGLVLAGLIGASYRVRSQRPGTLGSKSTKPVA